MANNKAGDRSQEFHDSETKRDPAERTGPERVMPRFTPFVEQPWNDAVAAHRYQIVGLGISDLGLLVCADP